MGVNGTWFAMGAVGLLGLLQAMDLGKVDRMVKEGVETTYFVGGWEDALDWIEHLPVDLRDGARAYLKHIAEDE